jgi:hypothetical protein
MGKIFENSSSLKPLNHLKSNLAGIFLAPDYSFTVCVQSSLVKIIKYFIYFLTFTWLVTVIMDFQSAPKTDFGEDYPRNI